MFRNASSLAEAHAAPGTGWARVWPRPISAEQIDEDDYRALQAECRPALQSAAACAPDERRTRTRRILIRSCPNRPIIQIAAAGGKCEPTTCAATWEHPPILGTVHTRIRRHWRSNRCTIVRGLQHDHTIAIAIGIHAFEGEGIS